jgi:hypothetical protein
MPGILIARFAVAPGSHRVPGIECTDAQLCVFEKLRATAHEGQTGLIPGYRFIHGQPAALQMFDYLLER